MPDWQQTFHKVLAEIEPPDKLKSLSIQTLQKYRKFLLEVEPHIFDLSLERRCRDGIQAIDREIESLGREEKEDRRHQESQDIAKKGLDIAEKGLRRSDVAIVISIVAILIAVAEPVYKIFFSKIRPSTSAPASPQTYQQTPMPTAALSASRASPAAPVQQTAIAQPLVRPPESSPR